MTSTVLGLTLLFAFPQVAFSAPKPDTTGAKAPQTERKSLRALAHETLVGMLYSAELKAKVEKSIVEIVQNLRRPGDPPFSVRLSERLDRDELRVSDRGTYFELEIDPGAFIYADNLSELAAVIAYKMSAVRTVSEARWNQLQSKYRFPTTDGAIDEWLGARQAHLDPTRDGYAAYLKTKEDLAEIAELHRRRATYLDRRRKASDLAERAGIRLDLDSSSSRNVEAALDAVDRLVAGGYDPWGMFDPLKRIVTVENAKANPTKLADWILRKKPSFLQTETEFMRNYLLYLEKTKVDITAQPFRGRALTPEQARFQQLSGFFQSARMGPAAKLATGFIGTAAAIGVAAYTGKDLWQKFLDGVSESAFEPVPIDPDEVARVEASGDRERATGWMQDPSRGSPDLPSLPQPGADNPLTGVGDTIGSAFHRTMDAIGSGLATAGDGIYSGFGWAWGLVKSAAETPPAQEAWRLWKLVDHQAYKLGAALAFDRTVGIRLREHSRELSNQFLYRYRLHLAEQGRLARALVSYKLRVANGKLSDPAERLQALTEIAASQRATSEFLTDGAEPQDHKVLSRMLYRYLYGPRIGVKAQLTHGALVRERVIENTEYALKKNGLRDAPPEKVRRALFDEPSEKLTSALLSGLYGDPGSSVRDRLPAAQRYQKWLYRNFGGLARAISTRTTELVIDEIASLAETGSLEKAERERVGEMLESVGALEILNPTTQQRYLDALKRIYPYRTDPRARSLAELKRIRAEIGERAYFMNLRALSRREGSFEPADAVTVFQELFDKGFRVDALSHLNRHFRSIARFIETENTGTQPKIEFFRTLRTLMDTKESGKLPLSLGARTLARNALLARILAYTEARVRYAFFTQLAETPVFSGIARTLGIRGYRTALENRLPTATNLGELLNLMYYLRETGAADPGFVSDLFNRRFFRPETKIESLGEIERILAYDFVWKAFNFDSIPSGLQAWEMAIVKKYLEAAKKYEPFRFDPVHSERIQRRLLDAFRAIAPNATPQEKIEFWEKLARRGTNGLTDSFFEETYGGVPEADRKEFAKRVLGAGLLFDTGLRVRLYKDQLAQDLSDKTLGQDAARLFAEVPAGFRHPRAAGATTLDDLPPDVRASELKALRRQAFMERVQTVAEAFPDSVKAFGDVANWLSARLATSQSEAYYLRDRIRKWAGGEKDLSVEVLDSLLKTAERWDKAERWRLIRWLRGTGPVPKGVEDSLRVVGPETVRRMFVGLPPAQRQVPIAALLDANGKGLLHGISSRVFEEQILDEILPHGSDDAKTAREVLTAGLDAFAQVSHPSKRFSVLAYLLAQPSDSASVGAVLRAICEAYGLPLIKMGQAAAASGDLLPPEIREELAKLRDQANEPFWHEIYERISEVTGVEDLEPVLKLRSLLGSASVKYAALVEDVKKGGLHALQIKRAEADASISKDFRELDIMVNTLIKKDPVKFAFLRGLLEATRAAIWRELSLLRESERTAIMSEEYAKATERGAPRTEVPETTDFVEKMGGGSQRFFFLRSSRFVAGKSLGELSPDDRAQEARAVLAAEHELLFPSDSSHTHIDPDRHPGNEKYLPGVDGHRQAIDFGMGALKVTPEDVSRITRLMALTQVMEVVGPTDAALATLYREFLPADGDRKSLAKNLRKYYPNRERGERSALAGYYYLLGELEAAGMDRKILNYDFVKAIFQLEPYEEVLRGREHASPKATFSARVEAEARKLAPSLAPGKLETIRNALLRPKDVLATLRNARRTATFEAPHADTRRPAADRKPREKLRQRAPQPEFRSHIAEVGNVYAAELVSAVFWGFHDRDPNRALDWLKSLATVQKHVGFGTFALGSGLTSGLIERTVPTSWSKTRWFGQHGLSMAVGMVASDIVSRLIARQPLDEIIDHELSLENFEEVSLSTSSFLAAQALLDGAGAALHSVPLGRRLACRMPYLAKGKTSLMFILAEGIQRKERAALEKLGVIQPRDEDRLREIAREGSAAYGARLAEIEAQYKDPEQRARSMALMGCGADMQLVDTPNDEMRVQAYSASNPPSAQNYLDAIHVGRLEMCLVCRRDDTPAAALCRTIDQLKAFQLETHDPRMIEFAAAEIDALYQAHAEKMLAFFDRAILTSDQVKTARSRCKDPRQGHRCWYFEGQEP